MQLLRKRYELHGKYSYSLLYRIATKHSLNLLQRGGRRRLARNEERADVRGRAGKYSHHRYPTAREGTVPGGGLWVISRLIGALHDCYFAVGAGP